MKRFDTAFADGAFHGLIDDGLRGIGDDCAVIPQHSGTDTLISTDMLVEGTHFILEDINPYDLGWKSAAVNISDIAAMGGRPESTFLSLAIPSGLDTVWLDGFIDGYRDISRKYGVRLLGGDTTASPDRICINVTVSGSIGHGKSKLRSSALPGDLICVTGTLGDSAAGLGVILDGLPREGASRRLVEKHYHPIPRVEEGIYLSNLEGVHAMMDISDGVASDLPHILEESSVSAEIDTGALPISDDVLEFCSSYGSNKKTAAVELALSGGEDYELLFTVGEDCERRIEIPHTVIGRIREGGGHCIKWKGFRGSLCGFRHFRKTVK